jgi:lipopolysaccharide export system permease protein
MIKKLDKLIIKAFVGPFIATFFIAYFVLMMQSLWKYVDDLVGKGLDLVTIGKFLWYASASMLTLAMPIAILISSIMTFGNLGERFELVAIKSAGISLLRFMRPLMWVAVLLCGITFLFANYVIPHANLKFKSLYFSIVYKKPALDLREGKFYTAIPGYAIKVGKKDPDGKTIHNVVIFEQQNNLQDNCIVAEKGIMQFSKNEKYLDFVLFNGHRYQERGNTQDTSTEFIRVDFKEYKKVFDIASIKMMNPPDSIFKNDDRVMSVSELDKQIDSLKIIRDNFLKTVSADFDTQIHYVTIQDSLWKKYSSADVKVKNFSELIPDSARGLVNSNAGYVVNNLKSTILFSGSDLIAKNDEIKYSKVEWHNKYSLSLACLVLFFIGAPLGSIIRKGGLGMPLVVAIIFFLQFHLLYMFGMKFARGGVTSPFLGMWLPIIVLTPVGIFLTYKAMHDSQLFNKELYYRFFKKIVILLSRLFHRLNFKKPEAELS